MQLASRKSKVSELFPAAEKSLDQMCDVFMGPLIYGTATERRIEVLNCQCMMSICDRCISEM